WSASRGRAAADSCVTIAWRRFRCHRPPRSRPFASSCLCCRPGCGRYAPPPRWAGIGSSAARAGLPESISARLEPDFRAEGALLATEKARRLGSVVVLVAQVRDELFAHHPAERVLELYQLNEQVVLRVEPRRRHRRIEVEAQPLLDTAEPSALREVEEQREIEHDRRRENRVATQE